MTARQLSKPPMRATSRFVRAYITTFVVIGSYLWLSAKARLFGRGYHTDRIAALHLKNARRIQETILRLQGLFIKVGQLFSIMTNFLPEAFRQELEKLQDALPARPYEQIERRIKEELGAGPLEIFAAFESEPLAAASLGQVHKATLRDGRVVAVKVQHLGVEAMSRSDLKTIWRILTIVKLFVRMRGLDNYYWEIRSMILDELDFSKEAAHIAEIAQHFPNNEKVGFPNVLAELSTKRVLTLDFVEGIKITDRARLVEIGLDPRQVARELLTAYCQMIFVDGVYHADPHPGNILVQREGRLVFLDFGAVGRLSPRMREGISSLMEGVIKADESQLLRSLRSMGFLQTGSDQAEAATRVIEHFHRRFHEEIHLESFSLSAVKIDTHRGLETLADLRQMNVGLSELSAAFHMPKEWVLLERTALLLTGLCTHLDPEMNPTDTIRPYLEEFVLGKDRKWSEMMFDLTRDKLLSFLSIPHQIEKAISRTLAGQVAFQIRGFPAAANMLYSAGRQLIYTMLAVTCAAAGLYFHHAGEPEFMRYAAYGCGGFGGLLFLSILRGRRFAKRL